MNVESHLPITLVEQINDLVGLIYDASLNPKHWAVVVEQITEALGATSGVFLTFQHGTSEGGFAYSTGLQETFLQQYVAKWAPHDVWMQAAVRKGMMTSGTVSLDDELVPRTELVTTDFYNQFLIPANSGRLCTSVIFGVEAQGVLPSMFSVHRGVRAKPFSSTEKYIAQLLNPHLSRALGMMHRLQDAEFRVASSLSAIDRLVTPIILLGGSGEVVYLNRAAQSLIDARNGLFLNRDRHGIPQLQGHTSEVTGRIRAIIRSALRPSTAAVPHFVKGLRITRSGGLSPLALCVSTLPSNNHFGNEEQRPGAIVFLHDTSGPSPINTGLMIDIYSLTQAEADVVALLCAGNGLDEIAKLRRVSRNTIKTQVDSAFSKTGTSRQSELVRVALALSSGAQ